MDLRHYNHVFNLPNGLLIGGRRGFEESKSSILKKFTKKRGFELVEIKIAPKRSSFKQTIKDFLLGMLYWAVFIAIGLYFTS